MPFSNNRNSRDDNSNRRRKSTSNYSQARGRKPRSHDTAANEKRGSNTGAGKPGERRKDGDGRRPSNKPARATYGNKPYDPTKKRRERTDVRAKQHPVGETKDDGLIRLNRYIANAGVCSRRKADELIEAGVVSVNGEVVTELGSKVEPAKD